MSRRRTDLRWTTQRQLTWLVMAISLVWCPALPASVSAQELGVDQESVRVVVGRIDGTRRSRKQVIRFQRALSQMQGIEVASTRIFVEQARGMRVEAAIPEDSASLVQLCDMLDIDAAIFVQVVEEEGRNELVVQVYAGENGELVGERTLAISRGRLTRGLWGDVARRISPLLQKTLAAEAIQPQVASPQPRPQRERRRQLDRRLEELPIDRTESVEHKARETRGASHGVYGVYAGASALSRTFVYVVQEQSPVFSDGGVDYSLGFVPGFALEAFAFPFSNQSGDGFGMELRFEKVFFRTQQNVVNSDGSQSAQILASNHLHGRLNLVYNHRFESGPELSGLLGFGYLSFQISDEAEYRGTDYTYLDLGLKGFIPFGTSPVGLEGVVSMLPIAGLGDTLAELGGDASTLGFRGELSLVAQWESGLSLKGGADIMLFESELAGEGRDRRQGRASSDRFIGARLMGGYQFK